MNVNVAYMLINGIQIDNQQPNTYNNCKYWGDHSRTLLYYNISLHSTKFILNETWFIIVRQFKILSTRRQNNIILDPNAMNICMTNVEYFPRSPTIIL